MTRWSNNADGTQTLLLRAIGDVDVAGAGHNWRWYFNRRDMRSMEAPYPSDDAARKAALAWLRRALKQAAKRLNNDTMKGRTK